MIPGRTRRPSRKAFGATVKKSNVTFKIDTPSARESPDTAVVKLTTVKLPQQVRGE